MLIFKNILGDQLLTWNGAMMSNKTFSEIEQIADASTGEIELVIRTWLVHIYFLVKAQKFNCVF